MGRGRWLFRAFAFSEWCFWVVALNPVMGEGRPGDLAYLLTLYTHRIWMLFILYRG